MMNTTTINFRHAQNDLKQSSSPIAKRGGTAGSQPTSHIWRKLMNDVIKTMFERRTIRKYTDKPVSDDTLQQLLEVIESTQSWANSQCWEVVNITAPEIRKQLQTATPQQNPAYSAIVNAPVLLALCAQKGTSGTIGESMASKHGDWYMYDLGLATQNLCLAAHSIGLGTVVVGWLDHDRIEKILKTPGNIEFVSLIPMGYRNQKGSQPSHKPVASFVHTNTF